MDKYENEINEILQREASKISLEKIFKEELANVHNDLSPYFPVNGKPIQEEFKRCFALDKAHTAFNLNVLIKVLASLKRTGYFEKSSD